MACILVALYSSKWSVLICFITNYWRQMSRWLMAFGMAIGGSYKEALRAELHSRKSYNYQIAALSRQMSTFKSNWAFFMRESFESSTWRQKSLLCVCSAVFTLGCSRADLSGQGQQKMFAGGQHCFTGNDEGNVVRVQQQFAPIASLLCEVAISCASILVWNCWMIEIQSKNWAIKSAIKEQ